MYYLSSGHNETNSQLYFEVCPRQIKPNGNRSLQGDKFIARPVSLHAVEPAIKLLCLPFSQNQK